MATMTQVARGSLLGAARVQAGQVAHRNHVGFRLALIWRQVRPLAGTTVGLGCLVAAAFLWAGLVLGLVAAGVAVLLLDWQSAQASRR